MSVQSWIRRQFQNGVSTTDTVPAGFTNSAGSFVAADGSTFPDGSTGPFIVVADQRLATEEKILIQSRSGATFTVAPGGRGYNGTTAYNHGASCSIYHTIDAQDLDEANQVANLTLGQILTAGDMLIGDGANSLTRLGAGTSGYVLVSTGTSASWVQATVAIQNQFTTANQIVIATGNNAATIADLVASIKAYPQATLESLVASGFNAAGDLFLGTGSKTGTILPISATPGFVLASTGSTAQWQYTALTSAANHLSGDYTVTGTLATFLTTASLAAGTWLVNVKCLGVPGTTASNTIEIQATTGTATATLEGALSDGFELAATGGTFNAEGPLSLTFVATVTVAGTLVIQAKGTGTIKATTPGNSYANATGYTAVRVK